MGQESTSPDPPCCSVCFHGIPFLLEFVVFIIQSVVSKNNEGDKRHPLCTPALISNESVFLHGDIGFTSAFLSEIYGMTACAIEFVSSAVFSADDMLLCLEKQSICEEARSIRKSIL